MNNRIEELIFDCSTLFQIAWKHKVDITVIYTQLLQDMGVSRKIGISSPLLLRDPQIQLILRILLKKYTEEALRMIQYVNIFLDRDKYWRVALTVPDEDTDVSASRHPPTRHGVFKYTFEFFRA